MNDVIVWRVSPEIGDQSATKCVGFSEAASQHAEPLEEICIREQMPWSERSDVIR